MDKYFQRSDDAVLADKLLRVSGEPLAVWLTDNEDLTTFHLMRYSNEGLVIDENYVPYVQFQSNFFSYCEDHQAEFLLPITDPTIELQHSLTAALNECDELRAENRQLRVEIGGLRVKNERLKTEIDGAEKRASDWEVSANDWMKSSEEWKDMFKDCRNQAKGANESCDELRNELTVANGLIEELRGERHALKGYLKEYEIMEDNLNRARSEHLEQLTAIMRMVQALDKVPYADLVGALFLIKRVLFEAICKLDPSQAIDL